MNRDVRLESKGFLWAVVRLLWHFLSLLSGQRIWGDWPAIWVHGIGLQSGDMGLGVSCLGTRKKLGTVMALYFQSLERPRCCIQWEVLQEISWKGKGIPRSGPGAARDQETKRRRHHHPRLEALVRGYRWKGKGNLQGTP